MPRRASSLPTALGLTALPLAFLLCCTSGGAGNGNDAGSGSGGREASGGAPGSGGAVAATGGASTGGMSASGGRTATGGVSATGGSGSGGLVSTGGVTATGGSTASGGSAATGGVAGTGSPGGSSGRGGRAGGGTTGSGGRGGAASGGSGAGGASAGARCPDPTWKLVWGDDFEGSAGTAVNGSYWVYDTGPNWYNGELQDYTSGTANASLDGSGNLVIEARQEAREGRQYTSARIKTEGKKTFTYGRIEGRMKMPYGQGMWPAFWMLGGESWPTTGEIDIVENLGKEPSIAHGTMHGPGYSGSAGPTASYTLPGGAKFSDDFHLFAIEWEANTIRWYVDDTLYSTKTTADTSGNKWVFDHGFFIILNLAVGGDWPGAPDGTTVFPQKFVIDYVHVCQK